MLEGGTRRRSLVAFPPEACQLIRRRIIACIEELIKRKPTPKWGVSVGRPGRPTRPDQTRGMHGAKLAPHSSTLLLP
jgi:hypothetical protein